MVGGSVRAWWATWALSVGRKATRYRLPWFPGSPARNRTAFAHASGGGWSKKKPPMGGIGNKHVCRSVCQKRSWPVSLVAPGGCVSKRRRRFIAILHQ